MVVASAEDKEAGVKAGETLVVDLAVVDEAEVAMAVLTEARLVVMAVAAWEAVGEGVDAVAVEVLAAVATVVTPATETKEGV